MEKRQLNVRLAAPPKRMLSRLSKRSGLGMAAVIEYALTLVDERELVSYANYLRELEARNHAA